MFTALGSIFTLLFIAIDRYRKVCLPLQPQLQVCHMKKGILPAILGGAFFFSWPSLLVYGLRSVKTDEPGLYGHDCSASEELRGSFVPLMYNTVLFGGFTIIVIALGILYFMVLRGVRKLNRKKMLRMRCGSYMQCNGGDSGSVSGGGDPFLTLTSTPLKTKLADMAGVEMRCRRAGVDKLKNSDPKHIQDNSVDERKTVNAECELRRDLNCSSDKSDGTVPGSCRGNGGDLKHFIFPETTERTATTDITEMRLKDHAQQHVFSQESRGQNKNVVNNKSADQTPHDKAIKREMVELHDISMPNGKQFPGLHRKRKHLSRQLSFPESQIMLGLKNGDTIFSDRGNGRKMRKHSCSESSDHYDIHRSKAEDMCKSGFRDLKHPQNGFKTNTVLPKFLYYEEMTLRLSMLHNGFGSSEAHPCDTQKNRGILEIKDCNIQENDLEMRLKSEMICARQCLNSHTYPLNGKRCGHQCYKRPLSTGSSHNVHSRHRKDPIHFHRPRAKTVGYKVLRFHDSTKPGSAERYNLAIDCVEGLQEKENGTSTEDNSLKTMRNDTYDRDLKSQSHDCSSNSQTNPAYRDIIEPSEKGAVTKTKSRSGASSCCTEPPGITKNKTKTLLLLAPRKKLSTLLCRVRKETTVKSTEVTAASMASTSTLYSNLSLSNSSSSSPPPSSQHTDSSLESETKRPRASSTPSGALKSSQKQYKQQLQQQQQRHHSLDSNRRRNGSRNSNKQYENGTNSSSRLSSYNKKRYAHTQSSDYSRRQPSDHQQVSDDVSTDLESCRSGSIQGNVDLKTRTTTTAVLITVVFVLSFLPHLCLQAVQLAKEGFALSLSGDGFLVYNAMLRSYFLNSAANPILYGLLNLRFSAEVRMLFSRRRRDRNSRRWS